MLIQTIKEQYNIKWKTDNGQFRAGFYAEVKKRIILAFPGTDVHASSHIESMIKC